MKDKISRTQVKSVEILHIDRICGIKFQLCRTIPSERYEIPAFPVIPYIPAFPAFPAIVATLPCLLNILNGCFFQSQAGGKRFRIQDV